MMTIEKTVKALEDKVNLALASGKYELDLTMKCNGDKVHIDLCSNGDRHGMKTAADVDFYLCTCRFPWLSGHNLTDLAKVFNTWEDQVKGQYNEVDQIREYWERHHQDPSFNEEVFSDWHKDVFGFRPRGTYGWMEQEQHDTPSAYYGDYGPGNPWDAPGMSVSDFFTDPVCIWPAR